MCLNSTGLSVLSTEREIHFNMSTLLKSNVSKGYKNVPTKNIKVIPQCVSSRTIPLLLQVVTLKVQPVMLAPRFRWRPVVVGAGCCPGGRGLVLV